MGVRWELGDLPNNTSGGDDTGGGSGGCGSKQGGAIRTISYVFPASPAAATPAATQHAAATSSLPIHVVATPRTLHDYAI